MLDDHHNGHRGFLKCMAWAGTGALFTAAGGVSTSLGLEGALAAPGPHLATKPFTFVQVSDSHIGFNLFVWPATGPSRDFQDDGLNVAEWEDSGSPPFPISGRRNCRGSKTPSGNRPTDAHPPDRGPGDRGQTRFISVVARAPLP